MGAKTVALGNANCNTAFLATAVCRPGYSGPGCTTACAVRTFSLGGNSTCMDCPTNMTLLLSLGTQIARAGAQVDRPSFTTVLSCSICSLAYGLACWMPS